MTVLIPTMTGHAFLFFMQKIYKYPFDTVDTFTLELPIGTQILCVQVQNDTPCIWAKVEPSRPVCKVRFEVFGTGHEMPANYKGMYIGTYQLHGGDLVFHLFEV